MQRELQHSAFSTQHSAPWHSGCALDDLALFYTLMVMADLGKLLLFFGAILLVLGVVLLFFGRTNFPLGRLPGDIVYRGKNTTFYFPLATSILLSVVLSLVLWVIGRMKR